MRRGGITSASDRRVSSDEQPSRTNGGPDERSAKPKRAKRRVLRRERLSSGFDSLKLSVVRFRFVTRARVYPCAYPEENHGARERGRARDSAHFSIPPQATPDLYSTLCQSSELMWIPERAAAGQCDSCRDRRSTVAMPRAAIPTRGHPDVPAKEIALPRFGGRSSSD